LKKNGVENNIIFNTQTLNFIKKKTNSNDNNYIKIKSYILKEFFKTKTSEIRNDIISKYILSENLNFLIGNGCSNYAGSKAINQEYPGQCKNYFSINLIILG
jgi:hypothetical protein